MALFCLLLGAPSLLAQKLDEKSLPLDGWIEQNGQAVHLTWTHAPRINRGPIEVARRGYGTVGGNSWTPIQVIDQPGLRVTDPNTKAGQAYEYRVLRRGADGRTVDVGYWLTGRDLPEVDARGLVHLVVEQTVSASIKDHLERFVRDLNGDGWQVRIISAPRHDTRVPQNNLAALVQIKSQLHAHYDADPFARHVVILVGHVPMIASGNANPDGHGAVPHVTDLIYGDVDGHWQQTTESVFASNRLPSDAIEMQVGRIDFAPVSEGDLAQEAHLLRAYFDKNHNWRHARLGDIRVAYGSGKGLAAEVLGLHNIVGPSATTEGGHHDVGEERPWLWGVDFGDFSGQRYARDYANKAIFAINFGSHKQKIDRRFNPMTALLAQPWYPLAVGWGARPAWWLHHMSLGGSIGDVHMRTVNNGRATDPYATSMDYFPTGQYLWRNPVWVNLLGDPTLRAFPLSPPGPTLAESRADGIHLSWDPAQGRDVLGYRVYKAQTLGDFIQISGPELLTGLSFTDPTGTADTTYMVRALGRKEVHAGSFQTLSQGIFTQADRPPLVAPDLQVTIPAQGPLVLPDVFNTPQKGLVFGFITGPKQGSITFKEGAWHYIAPPGRLEEALSLRFVVSDNLTSSEGILTVMSP